MGACVGKKIDKESQERENHNSYANDALKPGAKNGLESNEWRFGLYLIPDDPKVFGACESYSKGVNWGGAHITIAGFTESNGPKIQKALSELKMDLDGQINRKKRWIPSNISIEGTQYNIRSRILGKLTSSLSKSVDLVRLSDWHVYLSSGFTGDKTILRKTKWSLIMIRKDGTNVTWLYDTVVPFHDL